MVFVGLGEGEDNEEENAQSLVGVSEETIVVEKTELLTGIDDFSDFSPEVTIETLFKWPEFVVLEDLVICIIGVSETFLGVKVVMLNGNEEIW